MDVTCHVRYCDDGVVDVGGLQLNNDQFGDQIGN